MKNNIKKAPVKFWEDLLYFQHFMLIFVFPQISDYHHLKTLKGQLTLHFYIQQDLSLSVSLSNITAHQFDQSFRVCTCVDNV